MRKNIISVISVSIFLLFFGCSSHVIIKTPTESSLPLLEQWKEALIIDILSKTPELNIHRMNGQEGNTVFVNIDGREAVYDIQKKLVTDPTNKGSYNYYNAVKEPLAHFAKDTHSWLVLGNARNDPSSLDERLTAYLKDLKIGILSSYKEHSIDSMNSTVSYNSRTEKDVVLLFLNIISKSGNYSLFELYKNPSSMNELKIDQFLNDLEPVFLTKLRKDQALKKLFPLL